MKVKVVTDKACCGISLRDACLGIAIFFLASTVLGVIFQPSSLTHSTTLVGFIINLVGNLSLLFGALRANPWFVVVWLINAVLFFIGWPIAFFGVIFNYGEYRAMSSFSNIFLVLLEYIVLLAIMLYCAHLVYSFFHQLRNSQAQPQHAVVV